jgi:hypothetical protein
MTKQEAMNVFCKSMQTCKYYKDDFNRYVKFARLQDGVANDELTGYFREYVDYFETLSKRLDKYKVIDILNANHKVIIDRILKEVKRVRALRGKV